MMNAGYSKIPFLLWTKGTKALQVEALHLNVQV